MAFVFKYLLGITDDHGQKGSIQSCPTIAVYLKPRVAVPKSNPERGRRLECGLSTLVRFREFRLLCHDPVALKHQVIRRNSKGSLIPP